MSRFVSAGTNEEPVERDDEWKKAQQELEEDRKRRLEQAAQQDNGKSLFEVLQANKAAKQEAFEEKIRLKNQFRALDEDEAAFLDSVLESTRAKEDAIRKETSEQLEVFRRHQADAEKSVVMDGSNEAAEEEVWSTRKRKKGKEKEGLKGLKLRKTSSAGDETSGATTLDKDKTSSKTVKDSSNIIEPKETSTKPVGKPTVSSNTETANHQPAKTVPPPKPAGLGLGGYSSDED